LHLAQRGSDQPMPSDYSLRDCVMSGANTPAFGATPNAFGGGIPASQSAFGGGGLFGVQAQQQQQQQQQVQTQMAPTSFSGSRCSIQPT
jgi:hypothetical protein